MVNEKDQVDPVPMTGQRECDRVRREKLAGYFFDLSKLSFAGMVAGIILPLVADAADVSKWVVLILGATFTVSLALYAAKLLR